tara:strand:+ start:321 stop:530 length:210 start_codon:yes stop_codon:yes gene_type:complete
MNHYAGSISFDNDQGEWQDQIVTAFEYDTLVEKMTRVMSMRKNAEVHFAVLKMGKKEFDLTEKVKSAVS